MARLDIGGCGNCRANTGPERGAKKTSWGPPRPKVLATGRARNTCADLRCAVNKYGRLSRAFKPSRIQWRDWILVDAATVAPTQGQNVAPRKLAGGLLGQKCLLRVGREIPVPI